MTLSDRELGMNRPISRRDFLNGVAAATAAAAMPGCDLFNGNAGVPPAGYPPARTGLRGNHVGSFEAAHDLVWNGRTAWGDVQEAESGVFDLIVVGAGVSGLAAAYFYRREHPGARILVLDNHDDFGGHAKRNEFGLNGRLVIGYGGSQSLEEPRYYSEVARDLLREIGVEIRRFDSAYDQEFHRRNGLAGGTYFDRSTFGADTLVRFPLVDYSTFLPVANPSLGVRDAVSRMPLGRNARRELTRLLEARGNRLPEIPADRQEEYLGRLSYRDFLMRHMEVTDPDVLALFQGLIVDTTASIEASPALVLMDYNGFPGLAATALADYGKDDAPYIFHFPDGNATIARLLLRRLIPQVAAGATMDDIVLAEFDYARMDDEASNVRLRLNSTVVRVEHGGPLKDAKHVSATYVHEGRAFRVRGRYCVMAGDNAMIPHVCPELPAAQDEALGLATRAPIIYTNVLLRNWRPWKELGIGIFGSPGAFYALSMLDFPVSLGDYEFSPDPEHPIIVHMEHFAKGDDHEASVREQRRAGRRELFSTPFETIERRTREQLAGALGAGGFDPADDIAGITVNRWAHGYAYWPNPLFDAQHSGSDAPHVVGRRRCGRIAIANSDAGANATIDTAIDQAHRAIAEIVAR